VDYKKATTQEDQALINFIHIQDGLKNGFAKGRNFNIIGLVLSSILYFLIQQGNHELFGEKSLIYQGDLIGRKSYSTMDTKVAAN
jgi:hypothetical protein